MKTLEQIKNNKTINTLTGMEAIATNGEGIWFINDDTHIGIVIEGLGHAVGIQFSWEDGIEVQAN
jgi:hypothetical protein